MTKPLNMLFVALFASVFSGASLARDQVMMCVPDTQMRGNSLYYYLPNTGTALRCEFGGPQARPNLRQLYAAGWHLVSMQQIDPRASGNRFVPPVLYLERTVPDRTVRQSAAGPNGHK